MTKANSSTCCMRRSRLLISPVEETDLLQEALACGFHYRTTSGGDLVKLPSPLDYALGR